MSKFLKLIKLINELTSKTLKNNQSTNRVTIKEKDSNPNEKLNLEFKIKFKDNVYHMDYEDIEKFGVFINYLPLYQNSDTIKKKETNIYIDLEKVLENSGINQNKFDNSTFMQLIEISREPTKEFLNRPTRTPTELAEIAYLSHILKNKNVFVLCIEEICKRIKQEKAIDVLTENSFIWEVTEYLPMEILQIIRGNLFPIKNRQSKILNLKQTIILRSIYLFSKTKKDKTFPKFKKENHIKKIQIMVGEIPIYKYKKVYEIIKTLPLDLIEKMRKHNLITISETEIQKIANEKHGEISIQLISELTCQKNSLKNYRKTIGEIEKIINSIKTKKYKKQALRMKKEFKYLAKKTEILYQFNNAVNKIDHIDEENKNSIKKMENLLKKLKKLNGNKKSEEELKLEKIINYFKKFLEYKK